MEDEPIAAADLKVSNMPGGDKGRGHDARSGQTAADETADQAGTSDETGSEESAPRTAWWAGRANLVPVLLGVIALLVLMLGGLTVAYLIDGGPSIATGQAAAGKTLIPEQLQGEVVKRATYGDWTYVCVQPANEGDVRCSISQQLTDPKSNAAIFRWRISRGSDGGLIGEWDSPTVLVVGQGIVLDAGWDKPARIPFETCLPEGCRAVAGFDSDAVDRLSKTEKAVVTMFPANAGSNGLQLVFSVKGLADALAALR